MGERDATYKLPVDYEVTRQSKNTIIVQLAYAKSKIESGIKKGFSRHFA